MLGTVAVSKQMCPSFPIRPAHNPIKINNDAWLCYWHGCCKLQPKIEISGGKPMTIFLFRVKVTPESEAELKEVAAPDFTKAVQTLAAWRPGIHILKLEGVCAGTPAHA
jgi:hypothetical protein